MLSNPFSDGKQGNLTHAITVQMTSMMDCFQSVALKTRFGIPLIYGIDFVYGKNGLFGATIFPHNIGLECTQEPEL